MAKSWDREEAAEKVRRALRLEDDLIIDEILTAETKVEAVKRIQDIERDARIAANVLLGMKPSEKALRRVR
jgi:nucleoside-triphosphatase THEP1